MDRGEKRVINTAKTDQEPANHIPRQSGSAESSAAGGQPAVSVAAPARAIPSKRPWEKMDLAETLASRKARAEARLLAAVQGTIAAQKEEKAARAEWSAIVDEEKGLGGR